MYTHVHIIWRFVFDWTCLAALIFLTENNTVSQDDLLGHVVVPIGRMKDGEVLEGAHRVIEGAQGAGKIVVGASGKESTLTLRVQAEMGKGGGRGWGRAARCDGRRSR